MDFSNINIRLIRSDNRDTDFVVRIRNHPAAKPKFYSDTDITRESHLIFLEESKKRGDLLFVIEKDAKRIGMAALCNINMYHKRAELGRFLLDPDNTMTGLGAYIGFNVCDYAFEVIGVENVYCEALDDNLEAVNLHENFGFKKDGLLRGHILKGGIRRDVHRMGIQKREWDRERFIKIFGERKMDV